jgi:hypothetical protein
VKESELCLENLSHKKINMKNLHFFSYIHKNSKRNLKY